MAMRFGLQLHALFLLVFLVLHASSCEQEDYWNMKLPKVPMPSAIKDNLFHFHDNAEDQNLLEKASIHQPFTVLAWKYVTDKVEGQKLENKATIDQPFTVTAWKYDTNKAKGQKLEEEASVDQPFTVTAWKYDTEKAKDEKSEKKAGVDQPFTVTAWKYDTNNAKDQKVEKKASVDQSFTVTAWKYDTNKAKDQKSEDKASVDQPFTVTAWEYDTDKVKGKKLEEKASVDQPFTVTAWKYDIDKVTGKKLEEKARVDQPFTVTAWKYDTDKDQDQKFDRKAIVNQPFTVTAWKYDKHNAEDQNLEKKVVVDQPFTVTAWKYETDNAKDQKLEEKTSVDQPFTITAWEYKADSAKDRKFEAKAIVDQPFTVTAWKYDTDKVQHHRHHHAMHSNENINDAQQDLRAGSVFFVEKSLRLGLKLKHDFQKTPKVPFLPQHIAHSIPFSMDRIAEILNLFSIKSDSGEATAIKETLGVCLHRPKVKKENRTCAQSVEDIVDFVVGELGTNDVELRMMRNDIEVINGIKDYVITKVKKLIVPGNNAVACHRMSYPYVVYYCHHQQDIGHYDVTLVNPTSGTAIQTTAVCHYDTYAWQPDVPALRYLSIRPGDAPVCHFSAINDMFWTIKDNSKSLDMAQ